MSSIDLATSVQAGGRSNDQFNSKSDFPKLTVKADNVLKDHRQSQEHRALEMLHDFILAPCTAQQKLKIHAPCF